MMNSTGRWVTIVRMPDRIVQTAVRQEQQARDLAEKAFGLMNVTEVTVDFIANYKGITQIIVWL